MRGTLLITKCIFAAVRSWPDSADKALYPITAQVFATVRSWPGSANKALLLFTIWISVATSLGAQTGIYRKPMQLDWQLEYAQDDRSRKKNTEATVPGAAQLDIAAGGKLW